MDILEERLNQWNIKISPLQKNQFDRFYKMLIEWNRVMNLTAITDYEEVVMKHFVDSLSIINVLDMNDIDTIIDIGTGAGFPGIPLKIIYPHLNITLLDSLNKRIRFLDAVKNELNMTNIYLIHGRAEDYARKENYRENNDLCVSRAVSNLATLSEYCLPYVKVGGTFISYKSGDVDSELEDSKKAVRVLGGKVENISKFYLPETNISRALVKITKIKSTDKKYPRKAGIPGKEPIR